MSIRDRRAVYILSSIAALVIMMGIYYAPSPPVRDTSKMHPAARTQLFLFQEALNRYMSDNSRPPTTDQGLRALIAKPAIRPIPMNWRGPYLAETNGVLPHDPWGKPYRYQSPGPRGEAYVIMSLGADGLEGGTGDNADLTATPQVH